MEKTEQLIRELIKEVLLSEAGRRSRKKRSSQAFRPKNITSLLVTRIQNELEWKNDVNNAMTRADGRVPDAADSLGVSTRTLYRNLEDSALDGVERAPMGRPTED
jgi:transcriptional regulator of acetoin/glycerol metabolism